MTLYSYFLVTAFTLLDIAFGYALCLLKPYMEKKLMHLLRPSAPVSGLQSVPTKKIA